MIENLLHCLYYVSFILFLYDSLIYIVFNKNDRPSGKTELSNTKDSEKCHYGNIVIYCSMIVIMVLFGVLVIKTIQYRYTVIIFMSFVFILRTCWTVDALKVAGHLLYSSKTYGLSRDESAVFYVIGIGIIGTYSLFSYSKVASCISSAYYAGWIKDVLLAMYIEFFYMAFVLLLYFLMMTPCNQLKLGCECILHLVERDEDRLGRIKDWLYEGNYSIEKYSGVIFKALNQGEDRRSILQYIKFIMTFILDVIRNILAILFVIITNLLIIIVHLILQLSNVIRFILGVFTVENGKKKLRIALKLSVILSLLAVVTINRIEPVFCNNITEILEFWASAIIIPLVFEWIYFKRSK